MNYSEKLRDTRWQKKRLEVFQRDEFRCTLCQSKQKTLHVHHLKYNADPWDAEIDDLKTLCENCHLFIEHLKSTKVGYPVLLAWNDGCDQVTGIFPEFQLMVWSLIPGEKKFYRLWSINAPDAEAMIVDLCDRARSIIFPADGITDYKSDRIIVNSRMNDIYDDPIPDYKSNRIIPGSRMNDMTDSDDDF